jgi:tRNA(Ile)-lysidine synthase
MIEDFKKVINDNNLCSDKDRILVGVSGGLDSVVLLDLFATSGFNIAIAHANFQLRGEESDEDEAFVRKLAEKYHADFFTKHFNTKTFAKKNRVSLQEAARDLRYQWFEELSLELGFDRIAIAHQQDDLTETFFINLIRGSGIKGLKSIPMKRGKVIRPLLYANRNKIEAYANANAIVFREDSSNASEEYLRNRIRHQLSPVFLQTDHRALEGIEKSITFLQEDYLVFNQLINEKRQEMIIRNGEYLSIHIEDLLSLQPADTWSYYLLFPFGFNRETTNSIAKSSESNESGKVFYSTSHELLIDRDHLLIRDKPQISTLSEVLIQTTDTEITFPVKIKISELKIDQFHIPANNPAIAWLDMDKLNFPLKLRPWVKGDRFMPFGMKGSKLVSDYLTDEKVNLFEKEKVMVLLSGNDIVWVVGYRSSENHKVDDQTEKVCKMELSV